MSLFSVPWYYNNNKNVEEIIQTLPDIMPNTQENTEFIEVDNETIDDNIQFKKEEVLKPLSKYDEVLEKLNTLTEYLTKLDKNIKGIQKTVKKIEDELPYIKNKMESSYKEHDNQINIIATSLLNINNNLSTKKNNNMIKLSISDLGNQKLIVKLKNNLNNNCTGSIINRKDLDSFEEELSEITNRYVRNKCKN